VNNREYLAANPGKLAEVAAQGVCDCCAYRDAVPCGDCDEGVSKWLESEHAPETFHDEFYDCECTVDVSEDTREKLEADACTFVARAWEAGRTYERRDSNTRCEDVAWSSDELIDLLDRQAAITEREGREAWHKAASGEIYQANQRAEQILAEYDKLQKDMAAWIGCPGYDAPSHRCRYHDQDFELNDRTVNALKRENAKLQEQIDRILRAPNLSKGVNMQLVEGVEALNERVSDLEAEVEQYELLCQRWEDLYHAVRDQRNAMRDRLAELEEGEGHE
jgi:hypothetical protein